jgi:acetyltransferase-like isoleucine patch superfamily enzyme
MSSVPWILSFLWRVLKKFRLLIVQARYNSYTIAEYYRKQGAQIGENCDIATSSLGTEPYLISIGNHVLISEGVVFHTHDGGVWIFRENNPGIRVYGTIVIEDNCLIGRNAQLLPNIRIGRNSIVGAGSVVIADVPPNSVVIGVPARVISSIQKYEENCLSKWKEQKPPDLHIEEGREWWTSRKNRQKLRRHLTNLLIDQSKAEEETDK